MYRTRFLLFSVCFSIVCCARSQQKQAQGETSLAALQQRLSSHVSHPRFAGAVWGVKITSLDSGITLFETNSEKLLSPASNSKLYTVALGLDHLGGDFRIKTSLYATAKPSADGTLKGDFIVYGRGDPTINERLHSNDINQALQPLVAALSKAGVKRITGDLVGDDSYFRGPRLGSGWAWDDMESYYGAEISALTINDNVSVLYLKPNSQPGGPCELRLSPGAGLVLSNRTETLKEATRSINCFRPPGQNVVYVSGRMGLMEPETREEITSPNPAALFVSLFKEALACAGIKIEGQARTVNWLERQGSPLNFDNLVELGSVPSLPVSDIAREILKPSQNLYADLLLAQVGERTRDAQNPGDRTSEELGIRELNRFLGEAGVPKGDVLFEEGSGLSRNNLTTARATVALLEFMSHHKTAEAFRLGLPIAGVDGTLRNRMKGTAAAGNVRAKTGTLRWAISLSGYLTSAAGEKLVFSVMLNRYHNPNGARSGRDEVDTIPVMLAEFSGKSSEAQKH